MDLSKLITYAVKRVQKGKVPIGKVKQNCVPGTYKTKQEADNMAAQMRVVTTVMES